jgi:hypothetical protein
MDASTSGAYTTASNVVALDDEAKYAYCVSGSKMTWSSQSTSLTTTGTIVFQKGGAGSGGSTGGGGATGSGGKTGAGGAGGATSSGGVTGAGGATGPASGGSTGTGTRTDGPCDIYAAASPATPCAAAYSMVRALSKSYTGPLYQVRSGSSTSNTGTGGTTKDIGMLADGFADSAAQDTFCSGSTCTVSILYDQSGKKNDLKVAPAGCYNDGSANTPDYESSATKKKVTVGGHSVYALYTNAHEGYRNNSTSGVPKGNTDQGIYELADGTHFGGACCWDFGNAGTDNCNGTTMNTIFFGTGYWGQGAGNGPWFEGDFEAGVWAGGTSNGTPGAPAVSGQSPVKNTSNPSLAVPYAFGIVKTSSGKYAIRVADAQSATTVTTAYDGNSPKQWGNGTGIILGIGGDNSNHSYGTFFEGAITAGRPSDATDALVLQNVQAAGYGK